MSGQTLIFCVGAAKSGTSWLQAYLRKHDSCYFRNLKEMHYFDMLDAGGSDWHQKRQARRLVELRERLANHRAKEDNEWLPVLISDIEAWIALFDGINADDAGYLDYLGYGRVEEKIVGDITPSYGGVSREMLKHMATLAPNVKFIYIMREPVDRLWSGFRMILKQQGAEIMETHVARFLEDTDDNIALGSASDYRETLEKLLDVIPRENLHIELYERLFTQEALDRLCAFLEIEPIPTEFDRVVHKGQRLGLPSILRSAFKNKLEPQYNFVEKFMGGLPPEWNEKMVNV